MARDTADPRAAFIEAAVWHGSLEQAAAILAAHPEIASSDIHTAAILGDADAVRRFLARDPGSATAKGGPRGWDALTHLCFSKYLRLDRSRTAGFVRAATALLDSGASANTGFYDPTHQPEPALESVLYGAAGVAHHPELTRLLLERGADPNDEEAVYHSGETRDNGAMRLLVETGRLTPENLSLMLIRKHDWHDYEGAKYLLEHGADPNDDRRRGWRAFHHALARDNALPIFALLLDHGADPTLVSAGHSGVALAAREGRSDVLELLEQRGIPVELHGVDRLIAACARGDAAQVRAVAARDAALVAQVVATGGELLAKFAGTGNGPGVRQLLELGVDVAAPFTQGDGYFGTPKDSLAIHVAAWRAQPAIVRLLLERGSPVDVPDARGRTPLALAVRACVDSYWTELATPESVEALLGAGASLAGVPYPTGRGDVDRLLRQAGAR